MQYPNSSIGGSSLPDIIALRNTAVLLAPLPPSVGLYGTGKPLRQGFNTSWKRSVRLTDQPEARYHTRGCASNQYEFQRLIHFCLGIFCLALPIFRSLSLSR